jgi:hypothetical protein
MVRKSGLLKTATERIGRAFGSPPYRVQNFKSSEDPQFVEKIRDNVGSYLHPPDPPTVLSVHEESQVQTLDGAQPDLPLAPGVPVRPPRMRPAALRSGETAGLGGIHRLGQFEADASKR